MEVLVNGETRQIPGDQEWSLEALLDHFGVVQRRGVAVAVNDRVVPRSAWGEEFVKCGDAIEIIQATQGG